MAPWTQVREPQQCAAVLLICQQCSASDYQQERGASGSCNMRVSCAGGECGVPFWQRFFMPTGPIKWVDAHSQRRSPEWFSFEQGPVHFLQMSTEVDFSPGSPQFECVSLHAILWHYPQGGVLLVGQVHCNVWMVCLQVYHSGSLLGGSDPHTLGEPLQNLMPLPPLL